MTIITDQSGHGATVAQTQGPQGTVSTVVLEDEKKILVALKELRDLLSRYALQLLNVLRNVIRHRTRVGLVSDFPPCLVAPQLIVCSNKDANQRT